MSKILYLCCKDRLTKTEYTTKDIFDSFSYPHSLYIQEGISFDGDIDGILKRKIEVVLPNINIYEMKGMVYPFECQSKTKDILPDYYEASRQTTVWFKKFLLAQIQQGNEMHLVQCWRGEKVSTFRRNKLFLHTIKEVDFEIEYNRIYDINHH